MYGAIWHKKVHASFRGEGGRRQKPHNFVSSSSNFFWKALKSLCTTVFFVHNHAWSLHDCIIAESHCMLYNWVSNSSHSLQFDLSMLTLKLVNWWSNRWNKSQYYTAGACLKWFYAAHQVLKLIVCIKACSLAQRMALDRPIDQTIKVSLNPSFHNFLGKDGWEMMVASSPNHTECCTTGSVFLRIPCSLTFPCWPWNWWIGQNHEKIANTIRPEPV